MLRACAKSISENAWEFIPIKIFLLCCDFFFLRFAFQYNPSLQPRALVVFGCISKRVSHGQIKQIIRILSKVCVWFFPFPCNFHVHINGLQVVRVILQGCPEPCHWITFWLNQRQHVYGQKIMESYPGAVSPKSLQSQILCKRKISLTSESAPSTMLGAE